MSRKSCRREYVPCTLESLAPKLQRVACNRLHMKPRRKTSHCPHRIRSLMRRHPDVYIRSISCSCPRVKPCTCQQHVNVAWFVKSSVASKTSLPLCETMSNEQSGNKFDMSNFRRQVDRMPSNKLLSVVECYTTGSRIMPKQRAACITFDCMVETLYIRVSFCLDVLLVWTDGPKCTGGCSCCMHGELIAGWTRRVQQVAGTMQAAMDVVLCHVHGLYKYGSFDS